MNRSKKIMELMDEDKVAKDKKAVSDGPEVDKKKFNKWYKRSMRTQRNPRRIVGRSGEEE